MSRALLIQEQLFKNNCNSVGDFAAFLIKSLVYREQSGMEICLTVVLFLYMRPLLSFGSEGACIQSFIFD